MSHKKILIFTVGRSDYGILRNLIMEFDKFKGIDSKLIILGNHFEKKFGYTYSEIKNDGIKKKLNIKIPYEKKLINKTNFYISKILLNLEKNIINKDVSAIILGDRYEAFAISIFCLTHNIPIIHFGGGSVTLGAHDENYRNFISKISQIHFVETIDHKKNLIKNNIIPSKIFITGAPSLENIKKIKFEKKNSFLNSLGIKEIKKKVIIVTFHPETNLHLNQNLKNLKILLSSLNKLRRNNSIIITFPNADTGYNSFIKLIRNFSKKKNIHVFKNLGFSKYFNLMKISDLMVGNSSSGIIESSYFNLPVINIGDRQKKRFSGKNVINCKFNEKILTNKIFKTIKNKKIKFYNPYKLKKNAQEVCNLIIKYLKK